MENWKAKTDYENDTPFYVAEHLGLVGDGVASDELFITSPNTSVVLKALGKAIIDTHAAASSGEDGAQADFEKALTTGKAALHQEGVFANFICAGNKTLLIKLKIPYYNAAGSGKPSSSFSLVNGPISGQLILTVPTTSNDGAFIAMYTTDAEALISDYLLAGGSTHCKFPLNNLPVGAKIYVIWASITASGIGGFSVPYPIIVT